MSIPQASEPWMPNGFPPPSFVVETERTSRVSTLGPRRGRWLAAAAILGVLLLIAGILAIARSGDDSKRLATSGTTSSTALDPLASPDSSIDPAVSLPDAGTSPSISVDPNATLPPVGGATTPSTAAPAAAVTAPPPPPGILTAIGNPVTIPTAYLGKPASGTVVLKNTGPTGLDFNSQTSTGLAASPAGGSLAPNATATVTLTLTADGSGLAEGAYSGRVVFGGSGGSATVDVKGKVAYPPTINPVQRGRYVVFPPDPANGPCRMPWDVRAAVSDSSGLKTVVALISRNSMPAVAFPMKQDDTKAWILVDKQPPDGPANPPTTKIRIRATDNLGAEAVSDPEEALTCNAP
ncbi:MAG: hypothetical protein ABIS47_11635 [Acidimicrobiales bacterium]